MRQVEGQFEALLRSWILGFHGEIKPVSEIELRKRVASYVDQERLYAEKVRFVLAHLPTRPRRVLDIGSSAGGLSAALAQQGMEVDGIEPSEAGVAVSIERAKRLSLSNVRFQVGVGEKLPFANATFDLAVSLAVLEHVQDVPTVVRETFRVLRPGGSAYFEVPNNLFPFEGHYKLIWLPMMPKRLAKLYVRTRGYNPDFLDTLHYMNRSIVFAHFRRSRFIDITDLYSRYILGKVFGDEWTTTEGRIRKLRVLRPLVRGLCGHWPSSYFINRAVFLMATKPN